MIWLTFTLCTDSTCLSESRTSSASWCTAAYMVRRRSTWSTSAYQSPTSLLGSISGPPVDDSWSFRDTGCKRTADSVAGPSAWNSLPDNLRDSSVSRDSFCKLLKSYCSFFTEASSALEVLRECAIQIYLLTYLRNMTELPFDLNTTEQSTHATWKQLQITTHSRLET